MRLRTIGRLVLYHCLTILSIALAPAAIAQESPIVRVDVDPKRMAVGEPVALTVTVLGPTWFPKPPSFPSFELANAITRLPPDSSYPTSELVNGETWSGIVRHYKIYPLVGASFKLSDLRMTVIYADPGNRSPVSVEVDVPEIAFTASVPSGAEALEPYIAGRSLALKRETDGNLDALKAGDALVVRYIAELDGLPAIFLPQLTEAIETPGVSVYADQPVVEEGPPATRTEKLTFVFEAGGEFTLPAVELEWWNTETQIIERASVPSLGISVAGPPLASAGDAQSEAPVDWRSMLGWALLIIAAIWLLSRLTPALTAWWNNVREHYYTSEAYAFRQLRKALHGGDPSRAHTALLTWLDRIAPGLGSREFAHRFGDTRLKEQLENIAQSLYGNSGEPIHLRRLERPLIGARAKARHATQDRSQHVLPPLNP